MPSLTTFVMLPQGNSRPFLLIIKFPQPKRLHNSMIRCFAQFVTIFASYIYLFFEVLYHNVLRFEHLTRVLKTKQKDCHSATSWLMIMMFVPMWLYAAIFVSLTMHTYRKDVNWLRGSWIDPTSFMVYMIKFAMIIVSPDQHFNFRDG